MGSPALEPPRALANPASHLGMLPQLLVHLAALVEVVAVLRVDAERACVRRDGFGQAVERAEGAAVEEVIRGLVGLQVGTLGEVVQRLLVQPLPALVTNFSSRVVGCRREDVSCQTRLVQYNSSGTANQSPVSWAHASRLRRLT
jgi:hypothetical protein